MEIFGLANVPTIKTLDDILIRKNSVAIRTLHGIFFTFSNFYEVFGNSLSFRALFLQVTGDDLL